MPDRHEQMRKYHEVMIARMERSMAYWEKVPPIRMGQEAVDRTQRLIEALTGQKGSVADAALDMGFAAFLIFNQRDAIQEVTARLNKTQAIESQEAEPDLDREEWERKQAEKRGERSGNDDWRG